MVAQDWLWPEVAEVRPRKPKKAVALRDMVRAELAASVESFKTEMEALTEAARDLNSRLFEMSVHQANIRDALRQSEEALKVAASLRAEWVEAKMLAKVFEQREFLRSPEVVEARRLLAKVNDLRPIGGGETPGPATPDERATALLEPKS